MTLSWYELIKPTWETLWMVLVSCAIAGSIGLTLGIALTLTHKGGLKPNTWIYAPLNGIVNTTRSIPFVILLILLFPVTRLIVGRTIGTTATIVPLAIGAAPFVARWVETALQEVDRGIILAARSMGATTTSIIFKVLIPEALPALISGMTTTLVGQIGYSAMAGAIGGGGLGDLAIRYGLHRYQMSVLLQAVLIIIILVQGIQWLGNALAYRIIKLR
jgi:D-methionine transport system permease protein